MAQPGIREKIYLGSLNISRGPSSVVPTPLKAQTRERSRTGKLYVDSLQPETTWPEILAKVQLRITWASLCQDDIDEINGLIAYGGPVDVCYWRPYTESFWLASGASRAGSLLRREALATIPGGSLPTDAAAKYAHSATFNGSTVAVTLGTADANDMTPWTAAGTGSGERALVTYVPVFAMYVAESQEALDEPHRQGYSLTLEEV